MMDDIINQVLQTPMQDASNTRRVQRVRYELRRRALVVASVRRLGPNFVSVTLAGDELADFQSASFDDHVKFMIDGPDGEPVRRDYTPRSFDAQQRQLTIEFALHAEGAASDWARQAAPGQQVLVGGPRGSMIVPLDYDWHLLVGDESALPAIERRLGELPAGSAAIVIAKLADAADRRPLQSAAALSLTWVDSDAGLLAALRQLSLPAGEGYAWCAGEAASMAAVRSVLLNELGLGKEAMKVAAYWKRGASDFHETLSD
jgi:NADPH-dependent ferric siderophore reductase